MKFEELPGIPGMWLDFLRGKGPLPAAPGTIADLAARAETLRGRVPAEDLIRSLQLKQAKSPRLAESIKNIGRPDPVVVLADLYPGMFGGPVSQVLKCLTAIKVCDHLAAYSINAVPVAWVHPDMSAGSHAISFLDDAAEVHSVEASAAEGVPDSISGMIAQIANWGRGAFDSETLDLMRDSFLPGKSFSAATAHLFSHLVRGFGMIVMDRSDLSARYAAPEALPVLARVIGPFDIGLSDRILPDVDQARVPQPTAWPQASATIGDARSRRIFNKYHLDLARLYQGEEDLVDWIKRGFPRDGLSRLEELGLEVDARITDLKTLVSGEREFAQAADSCREKVLYQIEKLRDLFGAALQSKEQTAKLRLRKVCNLMAPNGRLQEREIAGIQIPLTYSFAGLRVLYERLDILKFEHQLIWMD